MGLLIEVGTESEKVLGEMVRQAGRIFGKGDKKWMNRRIRGIGRIYVSAGFGTFDCFRIGTGVKVEFYRLIVDNTIGLLLTVNIKG